MSKAQEIEERVEGMLSNILTENSLELVDVEYVKEKDNYYLKIFIDKVGGIFISDCEVVSRAIEPEIDRLDFIKDEYILEVSSPGLDRTLRHPREFVKYAGRLVDIKLYKKVDGEKEFRLELVGLEDGKIVAKYKTGEIVKFTREEVAIIKLAFVM